ncbi:MAG TPA: riboflavin synthase, partial [Candidatus Dormibacteraeota bacterium]|nr:riboflavin synthase [Candidatus Dormibacteraeota bacterium]
IVIGQGQVTATGEGRLDVRAPSSVLHGLEIGESVAVNGVCLTVAVVAGAGFAADVMPETLSRTSLGNLGTGDTVNLEPALRVGDTLGGHLVTGHVDGVGTITGRRVDGNSTWVTVAPPEDLFPLLVEKGCVAIDGISLTVVDVGDADFTVSLIPFTRERTTAGAWTAGTAVNVEADLVAKYVQRGIAAQLRTARSVVLTAEA